MTRRSMITYVFVLFAIKNCLADVYVYDMSNKMREDYDDEAARFGPSLSSSGIKGYLLTTNPPTACSRIRSPPPNVTLPPDYRWIALIPRTKGNDSCDFDLKVSNAQEANFSAVIVYNYEDQIIPMGARGRNVRIPSSMVSLNDGQALLKHYLYNFSFSPNSTQYYHIKLLPADEFRIGAYIIPFSVVISLLFLALLGYMIIRCCLERRRTRHHRLPRSALKKLKTKKFTKGDRWEVCAICLDDYVEGAKLRILPCDHAYHMKCIDPWLLNSRRQCPVCKRYVFPNLDNPDGEGNAGHQGQPQTGEVQSDERTPLLQSVEQADPTEDRRFVITTSTLPNRINASSDSDDHDENPFSVVTVSRSRQALISRLPTRQSTITSSTSTGYGTVQGPSDNARSASFFVGSTNGTTDNPMNTPRSVTETNSDIETIDDDDDDDDEESQRMHSVLASSESNPAYVDDDEITSTNPSCNV